MDDLLPIGVRIYEACVACTMIGTVAVALRCYCKWTLKKKFQLDDAWILFSMLASWAASGFSLWGLKVGGRGLDVEQLINQGKFNVISKYLYSTFVALNFYLCVVYGLKMTLLSFYNDIFTMRWYKRTTLVLMGISTLWVIAAILVTLLDCAPMNHFWNRLSPGSCRLNFNTYMVAINVLEMMIDIAIFALPTRVVFELQMPLKKKIAVGSIFMLGSFVIVTSIIRLKAMYQKDNIHVKFAEAQFWSVVHLGTAFVCACAPTYTPLWKSATKLFSNIHTGFPSSVQNLISYIRKGRSAAGTNSESAGSVSHVPLKSANHAYSETSVGGDDKTFYAATGR